MSEDAPFVEPFAYPSRAHERKHGPAGYVDYTSYRPWLEDEFLFRCVYCLSRKVWNPAAPLEIDHVAPQSGAANDVDSYDNLVLACRRCNGIKSTRRLPDPCRVSFDTCLRVESNGTMTALNKQGILLIRHLKLNEPDMVEWRRNRLAELKLAYEHDRELYQRAMGFPAELPDLRALRPPSNTRQEGIARSCHARRLRGELPRVY